MFIREEIRRSFRVKSDSQVQEEWCDIHGTFLLETETEGSRTVSGTMYYELFTNDLIHLYIVKVFL